MLWVVISKLHTTNLPTNEQFIHSNLEIADLIGRGAAAKTPSVGISSERDKKNWAPRSIVFSSRCARARVSLSCKRALPYSGRRCVCAKVSLMSAGAPRHGPALPVGG